MSRGRFGKAQISTNKREVREHLYNDAFAILGSKPHLRMLILPGRAPAEEINCIRTRFTRPAIVAVDVDRIAVEAARAARVTEALHGHLHRVDFANQTFDFADLDFCGTVFGKNGDGAAGIERVAALTTKVMCVFVSNGSDGGSTAAEARARVEESSIGRERAVCDETSTVEERAKLPKREKRVRTVETSDSYERAIPREPPNEAEQASVRETPNSRERVEDEETTERAERAATQKTSDRVERAATLESPETRELDTTVRGRVLLIQEIIRRQKPRAKLLRVYQYRGNVMAMLGALFDLTGKVDDAFAHTHVTSDRRSRNMSRVAVMKSMGLPMREIAKRCAVSVKKIVK